tara:strand:- start:1204 stop:2247 length:1044 start_codon:yes stop_codon:yes gene_type:complete
MTGMMQTLVPRAEQIIAMEQATEDAGMKEESFLKDAAEAGEELMALHIQETCNVHAVLYLSPPCEVEESTEEQDFADWICSRRDSDKDFGFMPFSDSESTEEVQGDCNYSGLDLDLDVETRADCSHVDLDNDLDAESDDATRTSVSRKRARGGSSRAKMAVDVETRADCSHVDLDNDLDAESDDATRTSVSRKRARKGSSRAKMAADAEACTTTSPTGQHAPVNKMITDRVRCFKCVFNDLHAEGIVEMERNSDDSKNSIFGWASMTTTEAHIEAFSARMEAEIKEQFSGCQNRKAGFHKWLANYKIGCTLATSSKNTDGATKGDRFYATILNVPRVFTFNSERCGR